MKIFRCKVCGHISFDYAPVDCPVCQMAIENFEDDPAAISKPADPDNLTESDRKHMPQISIDKECGLITEGSCINIYVKVGEISHVMETEHFITYIDLYVDRKYTSRFLLTPKRLHPVACFHLNLSEGKLTAIANCNVHGSWMTTVHLKENGQ